MASDAPGNMPVLFVGHGNPLITLADNRYTRGWQKLAETLPVSRAILAISAHWYIPSTSVTTTPAPRTIHDFYGFPEQLFQVEYPAPGSPELAEQVVSLLAPERVERDRDRGIDHGVWSVLRHIFPRADVPVVQLSLDLRKSPAEHLRLAQRLAPLRNAGVLIFASGNIVHNLGAYAWQRPDAEVPEWAERFEQWTRQRLVAGEPQALADYPAKGKKAALAVPSPDHYLPLLYLAALQQPTDQVGFPVEGFDGGTMAMLAVLLR